MGGIVGNILCPGNLQKDRKTTKVKFLGFAQSRYTGKILNLRDYSLNSKLVEYKNSEPQYIFVFGSSAEVGKTTFVCNLANALKQNYSLSILKICGTGRLKDKMSYIRTEVSPIFDFVDFGLPTTYGICETEYTTVLEKMFNYVKNQSDMIICFFGLFPPPLWLLSFLMRIIPCTHLRDRMARRYALLLFRPNAFNCSISSFTSFFQ